MGMAITFGVMLHVDRTPAVVVPPVQAPVLEAVVVSQTSNPVLPVERTQPGQFNSNQNKFFQPSPDSYNLRGERASEGDSTGSKLDLFA